MTVMFARPFLDRRQTLAGLLAVAGGLATPAAPQPRAAQQAMTDYGDPHSYARPASARVTHVALDLTVDFDARRLSGTATLDLRVAAGVNDVILDTGGGLEVLRVTGEDGTTLPFRMGDADPILGRALTVQLAEYSRVLRSRRPAGPPGLRRIVVRYRTAPEAGALQWLEPAQTAGGQAPYLFSQGQAILTRTWIPTQDSPGIRQTWEARIVGPQPGGPWGSLRVVMSGEHVPWRMRQMQNPLAFRYRMTHPVPPYLIALAVGDIQFRALGRRTGVYSEPSMLAASAREFVDTERMVEAAEQLYGPYRWGRYDLLVLPPSFPFGGMENPTLTFATPTLLTGDRSLVSLVAHELAHSWSGNLVTNATWADFWLNEGFTTYFENRIMEALYGDDRAAMLRTLGWQDLQRAITEAGGATGADTRLRLDLRGRDPDDGTTDIAYEKGALFLRTIEQAVGRARFDAWLRNWFDRRAFQPATTDLFLTDLRANLIRGDAALERRIQPEAWIDQPGLPAAAVEPRSRLIDTVDAQARAFAGGAPAASVQTAGWVSQQWQRFLRQLPRTLTAARLTELDAAFGLSGQTNGEILFDWLELAIANRFDPAVPALESFLTRQGRRKFVLPLYRDLLAQGGWGRPIARRAYGATRARYHPLTQRSIDQTFREAQVPPT